MQSIVANNNVNLSSRHVNTITVRRLSAARPIINTGPRAMTYWSLDGKGCTRSSNSDRLVSFKAKNCPVKPVDVSYLCAQNGNGRFELNNAVFEQHGDALYVSRKDLPKDIKDDE